MTDYVDIHARVVRSTEKAIFSEFDDIGTESWVPKSQIAKTSGVRWPGDIGVLRVTKWWAEVSGNLDCANDAVRHDTAQPGTISLSETNQTFRQLAMEFHPDRNQRGGPTMRALNQLMDSIRADLKREGFDAQ